MAFVLIQVGMLCLVHLFLRDFKIGFGIVRNVTARGTVVLGGACLTFDKQGVRLRPLADTTKAPLLHLLSITPPSFPQLSRSESSMRLTSDSGTLQNTKLVDSDNNPLYSIVTSETGDRTTIYKFPNGVSGRQRRLAAIHYHSLRPDYIRCNDGRRVVVGSWLRETSVYPSYEPNVTTL